MNTAVVILFERCKNGTASGLNAVSRPDTSSDGSGFGGGVVGGGTGYGGGTTGTGFGSLAAGMQACKQRGGTIGSQTAKCYIPNTNCAGGCQIVNGRIIDPGTSEGTTGSWLSEATIICGTENGTMGEDNRCYTGSAGSRCFKGCDILGGRLVSQWVDDPTSIEPSVYTACNKIDGTVGEDGKCYTGAAESSCYRGCDVVGGEVNVAAVTAPVVYSCDNPENIDKRCKFNKVNGYCKPNDNGDALFCETIVIE